MGELQELDRLQKLRRHHQGLALAYFEPLQQTHALRPLRRPSGRVPACFLHAP